MSKANPIEGTIKPVPRLPTHVVIYRIEASPYYWARCYTPQKRYVIRSTKTTSKRDAQAFARQLYQDSLTDSVPAANVLPKTFRSAALSLLEQEKASGKKTLYANDKGKLESVIFEYFGNHFLYDITHQDLNRFLLALKQKQLAPATNKHYMGLIRKVFVHAVSLGVTDRIPLFPKLREKLQTALKRDYLTYGEYQKFSKTITQMENRSARYRGTRITQEFKLLANFMINSFIRPTDLRVLKHKHVQRRHDEARAYRWLTLNHPATKTNAHPMQTMPNAVGYYDELLTFRKREFNEGRTSSAYLDPDDYLFLPEYQNRDTAMEKLGKIVSYIFNESGIKKKTGKNLVLYSFRHTAIMYRLENSEVDTLALARNSRTGQFSIDKYYGANFTSERARVKLHSFLPKTKT